MFRLLFLVACSCIGTGKSDEESSIKTRLPDILKELCPGANVCPDNVTSLASARVFSPGTDSCCTDCSCGPKCAEKGNCCFSSEEASQHRDNDGTEDFKNGFSCLFPMTVQPAEEERGRFLSYYMVSSVPENDQDVRKSASNTSCGDELVAPWGSLYPVYSAKFKQIYKNMKCAISDGVTDGILWDAVLNCRTSIDIRSDMNSFVAALDSKSIPDYCAVTFIPPPRHFENIRSLTCFVSLISTCPEPYEFQIPENTGLSKANVAELCTNGLVSPYRKSKLYANVFCHICNNENFRKEALCTRLQSVDGRGLQGRGFIGLIDKQVINDGRNKILGEEPDAPLACDIVKNSQCRPIFCPSGQLRNRIGRCVYPVIYWYDQDYGVYINLTSEVVINITEVFKLPPGASMTRSLPALKSPWPKNWMIDVLFYEITDGSDSTSSFIAIMRNKISKVKPGHIVQNIMRVVTKEWLLEHNNVTIVLKARFMSSSNIVRAGFPLNDQSVFGNLSQDLAQPQYRLVYKSSKLVAKLHLINKLYQCDQVDLYQSEFILNNDETILYNTITRRFMFDNQYELTSSNTFEGVHARICIEDSGMYRTDKDALQNIGAFCAVYDLQFASTAVLFCCFVHSILNLVFGLSDEYDIC